MRASAVSPHASASRTRVTGDGSPASCTATFRTLALLPRLQALPAALGLCVTLPCKQFWREMGTARTKNGEQILMQSLCFFCLSLSLSRAVAVWHGTGGHSEAASPLVAEKFM